MQSVRPKVSILAHTPDPEKVVASAAKLCYSHTSAEDLMENLTDKKANDFIDMLVSIGHESPLEHISFTFAIDGVSRSLLAQITRHRLASFSVQSQRYVRMDDFSYIMPPEIGNDYTAASIYVDTMKECVSAYNKIVDILIEKYEKTMDAKSAEKKAIEDARFVLPNASETKIVLTMNARELMHLFTLRCCNRAQWEIRELAYMMLAEVKKISPTIFKNSGPACFRGKCSEGKMSCGSKPNR